MFFTWEMIHAQIYLISESGLIQVLLWMILLDIATGFVKSFKNETTSSTVGLFGVLKHSLVALLTFVISVYLPLFGYELIAQGFVIYLMVSYGISIVENWVLLGLPMPKFVVNRLMKLRDEMDTGEYLKQEYKEYARKDETDGQSN